MSRAVAADPRPSGKRPGVAALAATLVVSGAGGVIVAPAQAAGPKVPASQPLVVLLADQVARSRPTPSARALKRVATRRPLTGQRTVLPVLDHATDSRGRGWVQVRLHGRRPKGHRGWIRTARTREMVTGWHLSVDVSSRQVIVHQDGRLIRRFRAVVGHPSTPTPRGRFFVEEAVTLSPGIAGGPYALATSARSGVLQEFAGGPGQIALHGTRGLGDPVGSAASHGCIRLSGRAITWLAHRIGRGVPLTIVQ